MPSSVNPGVEAASQPGDIQVEAARYVLFGRILPALRHALVGDLQALRFGVSIVRASSAAADIEKAINRLGEQAGKAIASAEAITRWHQPDPQAAIAIDQAADDCLDLVQGEWNMRGILVSRDVATAGSIVRRWPCRELLIACLVALGDDLSGPADVAVRARRRGSAVWLTIRGVPAERAGDEPRAALPRPLRWTDVDALADAHSIHLRRRGHRIVVRFPLVNAGS